MCCDTVTGAVVHIFVARDTQKWVWSFLGGHVVWWYAASLVMKAILEPAEITRRVRRNAFSGVTQLDSCWSSGQVNGLVILAFV